jgi:hypothetical protein
MFDDEGQTNTDGERQLQTNADCHGILVTDAMGMA